ncbi:MAG: hypothetical protein HY092_00165 [Candidatus Kerfeldbacteria bacterium]|nr:hypothetical protein [Candidatus Kerfeldbacteria bacterium]
MTKERWAELTGMIKDAYPVVAEGTEPREEGPGTIEFIEFQGPLGHIRLELSIHPAVVGKRAIGGKKMGAGAKVQYEYSQSDEVMSFSAWRRVNDAWEPVDASTFGANA